MKTKTKKSNAAKKTTNSTPKPLIEWPKEWNANEGWPQTITGVMSKQLSDAIQNLGGSSKKADV